MDHSGYVFHEGRQAVAFGDIPLNDFDFIGNVFQSDFGFGFVAHHRPHRTTHLNQFFNRLIAEITGGTRDKYGH